MIRPLVISRPALHQQPHLSLPDELTDHSAALEVCRGKVSIAKRLVSKALLLAGLVFPLAHGMLYEDAAFALQQSGGVAEQPAKRGRRWTPALLGANVLSAV